MASVSSILEDIDDKFCQCCLCLEQYKDPRQLPCLHRYCTECLQKLINKAQGDVKCPLCQEPVDIPENGAEGLKKDFYMNEIIDYVRVKKSLKKNESLQCGDCSKTANATAYCFKCSEFLCGDCHEYHLNRKSLKDHKPHLLTQADVRSKRITLEQLSSLKEAPRCQTHPDNLSHLCCKTCSNLPICVPCTYGEHLNHDIKDVIAYAKNEKERLQQALAPLNECKENVYETFAKAKLIATEINLNAEKHAKELAITLDRRNTEFGLKRKAIVQERSRDIQNIKREQKERATLRQQKMEDKIKQIKSEYEKLAETDNKETEIKLGLTADKYTKQEQKITKEQEDSNKAFKKKSEALKVEKNDKVSAHSQISQHLDHTIRRFENLTATCSNILVSKNSWTVIQNVDNICQATESLLQDMKREFPKLKEISQYSDAAKGRLGVKKNIRLSQQVECVVGIGGFKTGNWFLNGITCARNGYIITSGAAALNEQSFINLSTMQGTSVKQQLISPSGNAALSPVCYCAPFNEFKVAIACGSDEIGLFDIRDQSYYKKNLCDVIRGRPSCSVRCITTDETNNHVIVGCSTRDVYLLDDQLNHHSTITLPEMIEWPRGITVSDGHLLVCDRVGSRACAVNMKGELLYEFIKPGTKGCNKPISVCSDDNGFIYILWVDRGWASFDQNRVVAQYSQDGRHLLSTTSLYTDALCITIAATDQTEKLLVAAYRSGKLYVYGLEEVDE